MSHPFTCPSCDCPGMSTFYELEAVPVNSVVLLGTQEEALNYPRGDISLAFCPSCGFIANVAFDASLLEYSSRYEGTQSFSATFDAFAHRLATRLIERYDLHGKEIIEIGCGQGEFLTMLCELGDNHGVGFDPAYTGAHGQSTARDRVTFIRDFYSEKYAHYHADFVCCKMTLEHIQHTADFVRMVRRSLGDRPETIVFFQVPDTTRVLEEWAFWDIYYEHCSYFSPGSLARLFRKCGFDVVSLAREYDGQYVMIEARPGDGTGSSFFEEEDDLSVLERAVRFFSENVLDRVKAWRHSLRETSQEGKQVVVWGGGSKAVGFLTTLGLRREVEYVVDINPHKQGTFVAGTGQRIVPPAFLQKVQPDVVIVMNPVYRREIWQELDGMGLTPDLVTVADG